MRSELTEDLPEGEERAGGGRKEAASIPDRVRAGSDEGAEEGTEKKHHQHHRHDVLHY